MDAEQYLRVKVGTFPFDTQVCLLPFMTWAYEHYYKQLHLSGFVSMKLLHVLYLSSMVLGAVSYTTLDPFNSTGSGPPAFPKPVPPTTSEEPKIETITTVATTTGRQISGPSDN
ncbi:unnamed protein product, partial [Mesorhabditis spiculigera]